MPSNTFCITSKNLTLIFKGLHIWSRRCYSFRANAPFWQWRSWFTL
jgi:hypothetical protein